jgi:hypothetical protein
MDFLRRKLGELGDVLLVLWPPVALRLIRRGAEEVAAFRAEHGREPTEQEWAEMARRIDREITGR